MAVDRRRMTLAVAVMVGATLTGLGLLVVAFIGIARHPADNRESSPAITTSSTTTTSTTALAVAMREWQSRAGDHFKETAKALDQVSQGSEHDNTAAVRAGCQRLHDTNAIGLQADLPTPDPALTAELQRMSTTSTPPRMRARGSPTAATRMMPRRTRPTWRGPSIT